MYIFVHFVPLDFSLFRFCSQLCAMGAPSGAPCHLYIPASPLPISDADPGNVEYPLPVLTIGKRVFDIFGFGINDGGGGTLEDRGDEGL